MIRSLTSLIAILFLTLVGTLHAQSNTPPTATQTNEQYQLSQQIPVMDGGAGPCSLLLTVTTSDGKPVYAATINVHIEYGFGGFRRLDLQAGTNANGQARFTGLPSRVKRPPLEFKATSGQLSGTATFDPADQCQSSHDIVLTAPKQ